MLVNEAKFLDVQFMAIRWLLTVISILVMGYLIALIVKKNDLPGMQSKKTSGVSFEISEAYCIGCKICAEMLPDVYKIVDSKAKIKLIPNDQEKIKLILASVDKCPTKAIIFDG